MVADVVGVKPVEKAKWAVVDRETQDGHVVGVHHAMAKTHGLPLRDRVGRAKSSMAQQAHHTLRTGGSAGQALEVRQVVIHHEVNQGGQGGQVARRLVVREVLEMPEADETGGQASHHGGSLGGFAEHRQGRARQTQGAAGRDAQAMHGLAAQEFADGGTQHSPSVRPARIGRHASAFELHLHGPLLRLNLAQQQGAAIAQLPGPLAELVAAVDRGHGPHARPQGIAAENLQRTGSPLIGCLPPIGTPGQRLGSRIAVRHPMQGGQAHALQLGTELGPGGRKHLRMQIGESVDPMEVIKVQRHGKSIRVRWRRRSNIRP